MHLTRYKPKVIVIGGTFAEAEYYINNTVLKNESPIEILRHYGECETENAYYEWGSLQSEKRFRGFRVSEIRFVGTAYREIGTEAYYSLLCCVRFDKNRVRVVRE